MRLSYNDKKKLLQMFPNIELSYEKKAHKKIHNQDFCITIPKGAKYFVWFYTLKGFNLCFFLKLFKKTGIEDISIQRACFNQDLCTGKGTILYGTKFSHNNKNCFNIEDIFYFKNKNISNYNQKQKLDITLKLFKRHIKQKIIFKSDVLFGLPIYIDKKQFKEELPKIIFKIPYNIYCVQYRNLFKRTPYLNQNIKFENTQNFIVKAKISADIYELYQKINNELQFFDYAFIRDYKTSVFMNNIFRNIKENRNLDALEESDDEEEFENISADKYVFLDKIVTINCVYNNRFKKWIPKKLVC